MQSGSSARSSPVTPLILPAPDATVSRPAIESPSAARRLATGIYLERDSSGDSSGVTAGDGGDGVMSTARRRLDPSLLRTASPPLPPGSLSRTASPGLLSSRLQRPPLPVSCCVVVNLGKAQLHPGGLKLSSRLQRPPLPVSCCVVVNLGKAQLHPAGETTKACYCLCH